VNYIARWNFKRNKVDIKRERDLWTLSEGLEWVEYTRRNFEFDGWGDYQHASPKQPFLRNSRYYGRGQPYKSGHSPCKCGCANQFDLKRRNKHRKNSLREGWYKIDPERIPKPQPGVQQPNNNGGWLRTPRTGPPDDSMYSRSVRKAFILNGKPKPNLCTPRGLYKCKLCKRSWDEKLLVHKWCDVCPFFGIFERAKEHFKK